MCNIIFMHNINTTNSTKNVDRTSRWKTIGYTLMLATLLSVNNPAEAKINGTISDKNNQLVEVLDTPNIIANIEQRTWVKIPNEYRAKINELVMTNSVMKNVNLLKFTEDFIVNQMKQNWWISKENQLLFELSAVSEKLGYELYDWSDGDDFRLEEFGTVIDKIENCWNDYARLLNAYIDELSADVDRRSLDATNRWLNELVVFYDLYKQNPGNVRNEEIEQARILALRIKEYCEYYNIDYKATLSKEACKFYWIE